MKILKIIAALTLAMSTLTGCTPQPSDTVTFRLWDENVAAAYKKSFVEFTKDTGIKVEVKVIPWSDYWSQLRVDVASSTVDDIFWTNAGNFEEYQSKILPISKSDFNWNDWEQSVINQYSANGKLWGVPQLSDPGIALFYNRDLLDKYGVTVKEINNLSWNPKAKTDSLRAVAQKLTRDKSDRPSNDPKFDASRVAVYGFNAAFDLNAIVLNFLGSNGAAWQSGDRFVFDSARGRETFSYLADLINRYRVSPPASDTNPPAGGDLSRDLFIQGKMALFESGAYNLANVQTGAKFRWGLARIPAGPAGAISVTNGIIAAASSQSKHKDAQLKVLQWLAGKGAKYIGESGSALTAVKSARQSFFDFWSSKQVDVTPMIDVLANGYVQAPRGAKYGQAEAAYLPTITDFFSDKGAVPDTLKNAQQLANKAMRSK